MGQADAQIQGCSTCPSSHISPLLLSPSNPNIPPFPKPAKPFQDDLPFPLGKLLLNLQEQMPPPPGRLLELQDRINCFFCPATAL